MKLAAAFSPLWVINLAMSHGLLHIIFRYPFTLIHRLFTSISHIFFSYVWALFRPSSDEAEYETKRRHDDKSEEHIWWHPVGQYIKPSNTSFATGILQAKVSGLQDKILEAEDGLRHLEQDRAKLSTILMDAKATRQPLQEIVVEIESYLNASANKLRETDTRMRKTEQQLQQHIQATAPLLPQLRDTKTRLAKAEQELQGFQQTTTHLSSQLRDTKTRLAKADQELQSLQQQARTTTALPSQLRDVETRLVKAEQEVQGLHQTTTPLPSQLNDTKTRLATAERVLQGLHQAQTTYALSSQLIDTNARLETAEQELQGLQRQVQTTTTISSQLLDTETRLAKAEQELQQEVQTTTALSSQLRDSGTRWSKAEQELQDLRKEVHVKIPLSLQLRDTKTRLGKAEQELEGIQQEVHDIEHQSKPEPSELSSSSLSVAPDETEMVAPRSTIKRKSEKASKVEAPEGAFQTLETEILRKLEALKEGQDEQHKTLGETEARAKHLETQMEELGVMTRGNLGSSDSKSLGWPTRLWRSISGTGGRHDRTL
ncbi:hypothetical protein FRB95_005645 [Tulasnella sp. JGI-2019a]|nr:hypothetical protein FRB95_005645 [Tulasnella sp. JGI-2019a]